METENTDYGRFDRLPRTLLVWDDSDKDCLILFKNAQSPSIFHTFIGSIPNRDYENIVDGTIVSIVRLDVWIITNTALLTVQLKRGGGRNSGLKILYASNLKLGIEQLIGCFKKFVDEWNGE